MAAQVGNIIFQISADLRKIQANLKTMEGNFNTSFNKIQGLANSFGKGLLGGIAGALSVGAIVQFGKQVLDLGGHFTDLAEQTGLSVELLTGVKSVMEEAGTSADAFAKGVYNLQKNLGSIDAATDPAAQAVHHLGLNLNDLRNSSPDDFIRKVTEALAKIENPVERNTLLFTLLGKSAKELGPALQQLIGRFDEFKRKGLTLAEAQALDAVGDALTRLGNQALFLGAEAAAGLLRFFNILRDVPKVAQDIEGASRLLARSSGIPIETIEGMTTEKLKALKPGALADSGNFNFARDRLIQLRQEFDKLNRPNLKAPPAFKQIFEGAKSASKETNLLNGFLDGLEKQLAGLENRKVELLFGDDAALIAKLDADLAAFKENLRDKNMPIPKGLDDFFNVLRNNIIDTTRELKTLTEGLDEIVARQQAFADAANEGVGPQIKTPQDAAREKQALDDFNEMRKELARGAIDQSTPAGKEKARIAGIVDEFEKAKIKLEELGYAAGKSQEEIAAGVADAWNKATQEINNKTDEITEFQRRAFERMADAFSDLFRDALDGQIKSWEDAGNRIKKVMDDIVSEFLAMQLKILILGPEYGKQGGQLGGLVGAILGNTAGGGGLPVGVGQRPDNVQGPLLPNGGFYDAQNAMRQGGSAPSSILGGVTSGFVDRRLDCDCAPEDGMAYLQNLFLDNAKNWTETLKKVFGEATDFFGEDLSKTLSDVFNSTNTGSSGGSSGGGLFGSLFGMVAGLFGGGGDVFAGGATGYEAGFFHSGGEITADLRNAQKKSLVVMHSGGEVPVMAQSGEFMLNRWASASIGKDQLNYMNATGKVPGNPGVFQFTFNGVSDMDSFRKSQAQLSADLARAVAKGQRQL